MRLLNRVIGLATAAAGLILTAWAPRVFTAVTHQPLPLPVTSDQAAMLVWSGVAFARVFGVVLFGVGAVVWATSAPVVRARAVEAALLACFLLGTAVVAAQQVAIWANGIGWSLVGLFSILAVATGLRLLHGAHVEAA